MALFRQTAAASSQAQANLLYNQSNLRKSFNRLSSGYRISFANDDAASLALSEGMRSQIRAFSIAERNAADGIAMAQTAEGALEEIHNVTGRMREIAAQASHGSLTACARMPLQTEFTNLQAKIKRIQDCTKFNGHPLLSSGPTAITLQVGLSDIASEQITINLGGLVLTSLLSKTAIDGMTPMNALDSLREIDAAIGHVSLARSNFGATMKRLEVATGNIQTMRLNLSAANSRIRDVNIADESPAMWLKPSSAPEARFNAGPG